MADLDPESFIDRFVAEATVAVPKAAGVVIVRFQSSSDGTPPAVGTPKVAHTLGLKPLEAGRLLHWLSEAQTAGLIPKWTPPPGAGPAKKNQN